MANALPAHTAEPILDDYYIDPTTQQIYRTLNGRLIDLPEAPTNHPDDPLIPDEYPLLRINNEWTPSPYKNRGIVAAPHFM